MSRIGTVLSLSFNSKPLSPVYYDPHSPASNWHSTGHAQPPAGSSSPAALPEETFTVQPETEQTGAEQPERESQAVLAAGLEDTCPHLTRLADEWQVGFDMLSPLIRQGNGSKPPVLPSGCTAGGGGASSAGGADVGQAQPTSSTSRFRNTIAPSAVEGLAEHLFQSFQKGNTTAVMDMLGLLNQSGGCTIAVLMVLRKLITGHNHMATQVDWERGEDSSGKPFMRVKVSKMNDLTRTSGSTRLTIGSDGTAHATFTERWNSPPQYLSPDEALAAVTTNARERVRDLNRSIRAANEMA